MRYTGNYPVVRYHEYQMSADKMRLEGTEVNFVALWDSKARRWHCTDGVDRTDGEFRALGEKENAWYTPQIAAVAWENAESKLKGERKASRKLRAERTRIAHAWLALATSIRRRPEVLAKIEAELAQQYNRRMMPPEDYWHDRWDLYEILTWSDHRGEVTDREQQEHQRVLQQKADRYWADRRMRHDAEERKRAQDELAGLVTILAGLVTIPNPPEAIVKMIAVRNAIVSRTDYLEVKTE